jgi:hypothetical protein
LSLTLKPTLYLGVSREPGAPNRDVIQYEVVGLPPGWCALIGKKNGHWSFLRVCNGQPESWRGDYPTEGTALKALGDGLGS